ncbi:uncharacterized protein [Dendropsophus ebraccatus]|uniref:uncharacterized protein n=1 Tax=Dendropsophus ebraccatus TaxID=150705 RepID=UPI0038317780
MPNPSRPRRSFRITRGNRYWQYLKTLKRHNEEPEIVEPPVERRPPTKLEFMAYLGLMPTASYKPEEDEPETAEEKPVTVEDDPMTAEEQPVTAEEDPVTVEEQPVTVEQDPVTVEEDAVTAKEGSVTAEEMTVSPKNGAFNPEKKKRKRKAREMTPYSVLGEHNYVKRS